MTRGLTQKFSALAGLFAILLLVVAPLISQVLKAHDPTNLALRSLCSTANEDGGKGNHHALDDQACAYCGLAFKSPILTGYSAPDLVPDQTLRYALAAPPVACGVTRSVAISRARGPPFLS